MRRRRRWGEQQCMSAGGGAAGRPCSSGLVWRLQCTPFLILSFPTDIDHFAKERHGQKRQQKHINLAIFSHVERRN